MHATVTSHTTAEDCQRYNALSAASISKGPSDSVASSVGGLDCARSGMEEDCSNGNKDKDEDRTLLERVLEMQITISVSHLRLCISCHDNVTLHTTSIHFSTVLYLIYFTV